MLATFIIGLREGLEAALVVSIIATFLRRNGNSLVPLAIGVTAAVLLSLAVGLALWLVETSLPQGAQEAMETVIGAIAVCFVTAMVLWMNTHARGMKRELESAARQALGRGSSRALAMMAFLAVLKEGFETAVFLLATFSSAHSTGLAAGGAALGILCAVLLGYGLYSGGVRLNLSRFFTFTAGFLVLVAAGLFVTALGTAHEAGWLNAGQQQTLDLSWLSPPGSVRGALLTGVLGIPARPVLIQVLGWFVYLIPMGLYLLWPAARRPTAAMAARIRIGLAVAAVLGAAVLALAVGPARMPPLGPAKLVSASPNGPSASPDGPSASPDGPSASPDGPSPSPNGLSPSPNGPSPTANAGATIALSAHTATLRSGSYRATMPLRGGRRGSHDGIAGAVRYTQRLDRPAAGLPSTLTLAQLVKMSGGRLPVGFDAGQAPGPFRAVWARSGERRLWLVDDQILDFSQHDVTAVTLSGGGLDSSRTLAVSGSLPGGVNAGPGSVSTASARVQAAQTAAAQRDVTQVDRRFWSRTVPVLLVLVALALAAWTLRARGRPLTQLRKRQASLRRVDVQ